jgi:hypothetical protein
MDKEVGVVTGVLASVGAAFIAARVIRKIKAIGVSEYLKAQEESNAPG